MTAKKKTKNYLKIIEAGVIVLTAAAAIFEIFDIRKKKKKKKK